MVILSSDSNHCRDRLRTDEEWLCCGLPVEVSGGLAVSCILLVSSWQSKNYLPVKIKYIEYNQKTKSQTLIICYLFHVCVL